MTKTYTSSQYIGYAIVLFGLFAAYVAITVGMFESACSPSRDTLMVIAIPFIVDVVVLSVLNAVILPKFFQNNVKIFDKFVPMPLKLLVFIVVFGGIGYHINAFSAC